MKKFIKVCLIVAGVLTAIGLACSIAAISLGVSFYDISKMIHNGEFSFGIRSNSIEGSDLKNFDESFSGIDELDIDVGVMDMTIEEYDGENIEVHAEGVADNFTCKKENGVLKIKEKENYYIGIDIYSPRVTILIPKGTEFREAEFDIGVGAISATGFRGKKVSVNCGVGSFYLEGTILGEVDLESGVGTIALELQGKEEDFNYDLNCGVGEIRIGDETYYSLGGDKKVRNNASKEMEVNSGVGSIEVTFSN